MRLSSIVLAGMVAGFASTAMPDVATAGPKGCPPGLAKQGRCGEHFSRHGGSDFRGGFDDAYEEGYRDALEDSGFRVGDRLNRDRFRILDRGLYYDRYGRRLDDRYYYAEANGERLLIEAATGAIVDLLLR